MILKWHFNIKIIFKELKNLQNELNECEDFFIKTTGEHNSFMITYRGPKQRFRVIGDMNHVLQPDLFESRPTACEIMTDNL